MRFRATLMLGALLVVAAAGSVFGQGFQGGLRGSIKDAGGVIPGVEVTLTNEQTNVKRSTVTNERGEYDFANIDPGNYDVKATLQGYKTADRGGIRVATQQFLTLDLTMEVGAITENVTVTGQAPLIETGNASQGTVLDSAALQTLPAPGRNAFMIGTTVPTVIPSGDTQFNRQQDQTNASLISLGGGTRRGNNYTLDGVPITDLRNRQSANPTIEALDDVKVQVHTYDAEMGRTGGGVFNTTLKSGTNNYHGSVFYQTRPLWAAKNNYFSDKAGLPKPNKPVLPGRRRLRRTDQEGPHLLLVRGGELHRHADPQRQRSDADVGRTARRFLRPDQCGGPARDHLRPVDAPAVPEQPDSVEPDQPGVGGDAEVPAAAGHQRRQRQRELQPHVADQVDLDAGVHREGRAQVHRQGLAERLLSLQPLERAVRELLRHRGSDRAEPLRRPARLHPGAPAEDSGAEQHLGAERQLGDGAALRDDARSRTTTP